MRKRTFKTLLLAVILLALGLPAPAETFIREGVFSFEYPDGWVDFGSEPSKDGDDVAFVGGRRYNALTVDVQLFYDEYYDDVRLFEADEETLDDFAGMLESTFYEVYSTEIVRAGARGIPFAMVHGVDSSGDSLYAETIANGWSISFYGYAYADADYTQLRALTDEDVGIFRAIVASVEPALKEAAS